MAEAAKRLLWVSNDPDAPSGYGTQTREFVPRIKAAGYDPAIFAFWGSKPTVSQWETEDGPVVVFPPSQPGATSDIMLGHAYFHKAQVVVSLTDPLTLDPETYGKVFWVAWTPSDSEPVAPANTAALQSAKQVWAMSRHGEGQLRAAGFDPIYVPHGIDTTVFKPGDRNEARAILAGELAKVHGAEPRDLREHFLVVMNAANVSRPSRKGFWEALAAFKRVSDQHDDALLYVHTDPTGRYGEPLEAWIAMLDLDPDKVLFPPLYAYSTGLYSPAFLNAVYNAGDVLLHPSHGEGFGLPIVEAQATGTPVIVTDFSSMPELCFGGWKVPGIPIPALNPGCLHRQPDLDTLTAALEAACRERGNQALRDKARAGALRYDAGLVFDKYMKPALEQAFEMAAPIPSPSPKMREGSKSEGKKAAAGGNGYQAPRGPTRVSAPTRKGEIHLPRYVIAAGMMRSASTVHYKILIELLGAHDGGFATAGEFGPLIERLKSVPGPIVIKAHKGDDVAESLIRRGEAVAMYIERDLRDVIVSHALRKWPDGKERRLDDPEWMKATVGSLTYWRSFWCQFDTTHRLTYDRLVGDMPGAILAMARHLGVTCDRALAVEIARKFSLDAMRRDMPDHISDGRVGMWTHHTTPEQAGIVIKAIKESEVSLDVVRV